VQGFKLSIGALSSAMDISSTVEGSLSISLLGEQSWEGVVKGVARTLAQTCKMNHELQATLARNSLLLLLSGAGADLPMTMTSIPISLFALLLSPLL
jgi:hypothetical protein